MVDEHRPGADELDVVGAGVGEGEARLQRFEMDVEMVERGLLVQREAPFIGIGDERDARMLEQIRGRRRVLRERGRIDLLGADHQAAADQPRQQPAVARALIGGGALRHHGAQDAAFGNEHAAGGVAERARVGDRVHQRASGVRSALEKGRVTNAFALAR